MKRLQYRPQLVIENVNNKHELNFKSSSALALNSLFSRYNPQLVNGLQPLPPAPSAEKTLEPSAPVLKPVPRYEFSNPEPLSGLAEGIGDLTSAFASGDFSDTEGFSTPALELSLRKNPSTLFYSQPSQNPAMPTPAMVLKALEEEKKKLLEEEELKRKHKHRR